MSHDSVVQSVLRLQRCIDLAIPDLENASGQQRDLFSKVSAGYVDRLLKLTQAQASLTRSYTQLEQLRIEREKLKVQREHEGNERRIIVERTIVSRDSEAEL